MRNRSLLKISSLAYMPFFDGDVRAIYKPVNEQTYKYLARFCESPHTSQTSTHGLLIVGIGVSIHTKLQPINPGAALSKYWLACQHDGYIFVGFVACWYWCLVDLKIWNVCERVLHYFKNRDFDHFTSSLHGIQNKPCGRNRET